MKEVKDEVYYSDYDTEPIGGGNPYYRCVHCKRSDPEINGRLERHSEWCEYRIKKEKELKENKVIKEYLKNHLRVEIGHENSYSGERFVVKLMIDNEEISSDYIHIESLKE